MSHQAPRLDRRLADVEHPAGVAVEAVLDHRDVDVHDVAGLQDAIPRNAVADLVIDRGADRLRERRVAGRCVVERRRHGLLHLDHVVVAQAIEVVGGDAGGHVRRDVVEHLGGEASSDAHLLDLVRTLQDNRHVAVKKAVRIVERGGQGKLRAVPTRATGREPDCAPGSSRLVALICCLARKLLSGCSRS